ncbi:MAG: acetoin dehydrogenase dihydrolipoyllysine-residue acetyltransferase subunit [Alphaproteobacteria bacterium]
MAEAIKIVGAAGEFMDSVTVVEWVVGPGQAVKAGDVVVVVETAKAATDVPAPRDGILTKVMAKPGDEVKIGATLGLVGVTVDDVDEAAEAGGATAEAARRTAEPPSSTPRVVARQGRVVASPLARALAREQAVDLGRIPGSGPGGRIKRRDVERAARSGPASQTPGAPCVEVARPGSLHMLSSGRGVGAPIILLHGFGSDSNSWRRLAPLLERDWRLVMVDLPCHGASPHTRAADVNALAHQVSDSLLASGLGEGHFVGHSLGGAAALALTAIGKIRVLSLGLIAPSGLGPEIDGPFVGGFTRASKVESLEPWLRRLVADPARLPVGFAQAAMALRADPALRQAQEELARALFPDGTQAFDLRGALSRMQVPVKLIWGLCDTIIPSLHARAVPGHVGVHLLPDVGHLPQLEAPELVARLISELARSAA